MSPSRGSTPPERWSGLVSASLDALKDDDAAAGPASAVAPGEPATDAATAAAAGAAAGGDVDDLISKAALAVEGHEASARVSRFRMARLSADAAATLRTAIAHEAPTQPGMPSRGVTSGTRLDVQR